MLLWGFLSIALKLLLEGMDAFTITWYRLTASALVLGLYQARRRRLPAVRRLGRNVWVLLAVALLGLVGNYVLFLLSLEYVPPATSQLVIQLAPILFLLGGLLIFKEAFSRMQWIGLAVLVAGLLLFFNQRLPALLALSGAEALGVGLVIVAGIVWAAYALAQKQLLMALSSVNILLLIYVGSAVLLLPLARPATILSLSPLHLGLLVFCTFNTLGAYGCFAEALVHWEATRVSAVIALTPLVTIVAVLGFAAVWPGTDMAAGLDGVGIAGGLVVVVGSVMTALGTGRAVPRSRIGELCSGPRAGAAGSRKSAPGLGGAHRPGLPAATVRAVSYLAPTEYIESDHPQVVAFARRATEGATSVRDRAVRLYYAVRDGFRYDPWALQPRAGDLPRLDDAGLGQRFLHPQGDPAGGGSAGAGHPQPAGVRRRAQPPGQRTAAGGDAHQSVRLPRHDRARARRPLGQGHAGVRPQAVRAVRRPAARVRRSERLDPAPVRSRRASSTWSTWSTGAASPTCRSTR